MLSRTVSNAKAKQSHAGRGVTRAVFALRVSLQAFAYTPPENKRRQHSTRGVSFAASRVAPVKGAVREVCIGSHRRVSPLSLHKLAHVWFKHWTWTHSYTCRVCTYCRIFVRGTTSTFVTAIIRRLRMYNVAYLYLWIWPRF